MKIFIVFLAFVMLATCMVIYQDDMNEYMLLQKHLKTLAEDAAEVGALCVDSNGLIDKQKAETKINSFIEAYCNSNKLFSTEAIEWESVANLTDTSYGVQIVYTPKAKLFRIFGPQMTNVKRSSVYEWVKK